MNAVCNNNWPKYHVICCCCSTTLLTIGTSMHDILLIINSRSSEFRKPLTGGKPKPLVSPLCQQATWHHLSRRVFTSAGDVLLPWRKSLQGKMEKMKKTSWCSSHLLISILLHAFFFVDPSVVLQSNAASLLDYVRPAARSVVITPHKRSPSDPQQVHISLVGDDHMRVSWITEGNAPSIVEYGTKSKKYDSLSSKGDNMTYDYFLYTSGMIHNAVIGPLKPSTNYYYRCSKKGPEFSFRTPPSSFPIEFAIVGDLGQTEWTQSTLDHIAQKDYDIFLLPGDLSYADTQQPLWDSFGRLVEPYATQRPWMVTEGNHEIEIIPIVASEGFKSYNARWPMPYDKSGSTSNLYYSFDVASGGAHVVMLGSYAEYGVDSDQYKWLKSDLASVDRAKTPWVVVLLHAPWYNSNEAHKGEGEGMRKAMEELLYNARVDVVFSGHVHAYERFTRVYNNQADPCGPVYITIGDGGNREGLAMKFEDPAPSISEYREPSFGHGRLRLLDGKTAHWAWHRNNESDTVMADELWLKSFGSSTTCSLPNASTSHDEF